MPFERTSELITKFAFIIATFFAPTVMLMLIVGLAILMDTIAGRWAAKRKALKEGKPVREEVTSRKTRQGTLSKVIVYNLVVITFFMIDSAMINEVVLLYVPFEFAVTKVATLFICWIEFDSIDEKYYHVKGVRLKDKIRSFFRGVSLIIKNIFDFTNKIKPDEKNRSEEHTSELQSRPHLVCRLLLEKKKKKKII